MNNQRRRCYSFFQNTALFQKTIIILLISLFLTGCVSDILCLSSTFKKEEDISVKFSFNISNEDGSVQFSNTSLCKHQGNMCLGGDISKIWYGDQSIQQDIVLPSGDSLSYFPHGFCLFIDDFQKECKNGNCNESEYFRVVMKFSEERIEKLKNQGNVAKQGFVTKKDLPSYGYEVESFEIVLKSLKD